ncbi:uncharacterized protein BX664DRAFT_326041 [Halteromyces radiatus]|uniref:uncharacterized protein n=1 Tax=Halteromyces radiatus TaxID=101107 RepID=UPI00221F251F|nr:uncharacterized protein BX664DRAFT_326041 [Halteromyces radiatus]KAI8097290.1 hypothetical protein BX664DRAFT_326041 [Halteromyces radiatus]
MPELIVYLEPTKSTPLQQCLNNILEKVAPEYYLSTATKYPVHISVTGFFTVDTMADVDFIKDTYHNILTSKFPSGEHTPSTIFINSAPLLVSTPAQGVQHQQQEEEGEDRKSHALSSKHLLLPVEIPKEHHERLMKCAQIINNHYYNNGKGNMMIRSKRIDHISLAYWDEPNATEFETNQWLQWSNGSQVGIMIQDIINRLKDLLDDDTDKYIATNLTAWDIVLYERTFKGTHIGERHRFKEIARWIATI